MILVAYGAAKRCIRVLFVHLDNAITIRRSSALRRSTILAMLDLHFPLSQYAILTDEASANFHVGTDGKDNEVAGAMVACPTKALS